MKRRTRPILALLALAVSSANATPITLSTGLGGSDTETLAGITLGNAITFEYMFQDVTYLGGPWLGLNASVVNPLLGAFPVGQFNTYQPAPTGWLSDGFIDTSSGVGTLHDLSFTASTFGATTNAATILVRNVAIDGQVFAGQVPEPGSLVLVMTGLTGLAWLRRQRRAT